MKEKLTVGFDIDGVLADFVKGFTTLCNQMHGSPILEYKDVPHWNFERWYGLSSEQLKEVWKRIKSSNWWWYDLEPLTHPSEEARISYLHTKATLVFITSRPGTEVQYQTARWIRKYLHIEYPTVLVSSKKGFLCNGLKVNYFIDDKFTNCLNIKELSPKTKNYLLAYPHNKQLVELCPNYFINDEIKVINSLSEYLDIVEGRL